MSKIYLPTDCVFKHIVSCNGHLCTYVLYVCRDRLKIFKCHTSLGFYLYLLHKRCEMTKKWILDSDWWISKRVSDWWISIRDSDWCRAGHNFRCPLSRRIFGRRSYMSTDQLLFFLIKCILKGTVARYFKFGFYKELYSP